LQRVKSIIESTKDHNIVVLEAAVLLSANWQYHCHEIWVSIIPPNEVKHHTLINNSNKKKIKIFGGNELTDDLSLFYSIYFIKLSNILDRQSQLNNKSFLFKYTLKNIVIVYAVYSLDSS